MAATGSLNASIGSMWYGNRSTPSQKAPSHSISADRQLIMRTAAQVPLQRCCKLGGKAQLATVGTPDSIVGSKSLETEDRSEDDTQATGVSPWRQQRQTI